MSVRYFSLVCAAMFVGAAANAQSLCDGKYDAAQQMLDAAYGKYETLYSGGDHWHRQDNVGATMDLYRLWRGLPDYAYRRADDLYFFYDEDPAERYVRDPDDQTRQFALNIINSAMTDSRVRELDDTEISRSAVLADRYTSHGPDIGWWLTDTLDDRLSETQVLVAEYAQTSDAVNWLQFTLEASYAPWAIAWHLDVSSDSQKYVPLHNYAAQKYQNGDGIEWAVAAFLFLPEYSIHHEMLSNLQADWVAAVKTCDADNAVFAAAVISHLEIGRLRLTNMYARGAQLSVIGVIHDILEYNLAAQRIIWRGKFSTRGDDSPVTLETSDPEMQPVFNAVHTYLVGTVDGLIALHANDPLDIRTVRVLNLLSVEDLVEFARSRTAFPDEKLVGLQVAYLRYVALGRYEQALELIAELTPVLPDISVILESRYPLDVKLALVALELPYKSVWWVSSERSALPDSAIYMRGAAPYWNQPAPNGMDLPQEFRTAQILQRDIEAWLMLPQRWGAYFGMHGYWIGKLDRAHARGMRNLGVLPVSLISILPDRPTENILAFTDLIAWTEISQLGPKTGLSRRISEVLIDWADQGSNNRVKRWLAPAEDMANALRSVVLINRHNDTTRDGEIHLGQRAFQLLQLRFPETDAAQATPYWHRCSARCEE